MRLLRNYTTTSIKINLAMKKFTNWLRSDRGSLLALFLLAALAAYGFYIHRVGYTNDDWYLMYAAKAGGPSYFSSVFSFDRPLRAFVLGPAYALFGQSALPYNLAALVLRIASAACLLWLLRLLWPRQRTATGAIALLYFVYPGFLSQLNGIDYLPVMLSLAAAMLSLVLSTLAFQNPRQRWRWAWIAAAILVGWLYVGLVEYEIAFEVLRIGIFIVLLSRTVKKIRPRLAAALRAWLPYALIPLGFLIWNGLLFEGKRQATSLSSQLSTWIYAPVQTTYQWLATWVLSMLHSLVSAWGVPLYQTAAQIPATIILLGLAIAALLGLLFFNSMGRESSPSTKAADWRREALWLGLALLAAGPIPVVLANREIVFPGLSRYTLVSSIGVAMLAVGLAYHLASQTLRKIVLAILLALAVLTQFANGALRAQQTAAIDDFWWQVSWRVPQFAQNTTLVVHYPQAGLDEKYFVWSPANLIYYPEKQNAQDYLQPFIYAALPDDATVRNVLAGARQEFENRRTIRTYTNYRNILILSQPTPASCVQLIDGATPELSGAESAAFIAMAPYSEIEHVLAAESPHTPPAAVFGAEPARGWCYLYEQASLARQLGDWQTVLDLGEQAFASGFRASDSIEWLPFLQAYALEGRTDRLQEIAAFVGEDLFVRIQICTRLSLLSGISETTHVSITQLFCTEE
jgi:hypothetical protein